MADDIPETQVVVPAALYDAVICAILFAVGMWFLVGALQMPRSNALFDPGTFPAITGGLLAGLSLVQIVVSLGGRASAGVLIFQRPLWLVIAMVLVLAFPFAMDRLGYYLVAVIWVPVFGLVAGLRKPLHILLTLAVVLGLAKFVFEMLLGTPLP